MKHISCVLALDSREYHYLSRRLARTPQPCGPKKADDFPHYPTPSHTIPRIRSHQRTPIIIEGRMCARRTGLCASYAHPDVRS